MEFNTPAEPIITVDEALQDDTEQQDNKVKKPKKARDNGRRPMRRVIRRLMPLRDNDDNIASDSDDSDESSDEDNVENEDNVKNDVVAEDNRPPVDEAIYRQMPMHQQEEAFWKIIARFEWQNKSDQMMNIGRARANFPKILLGREKFFAEHYNNYVTIMHHKFARDGLFKRKNIDNVVRQYAIISHFVAMGHDFYNMIMDSTDLAEVFIDQDDYQSFEDVLPFDMQH